MQFLIWKLALGTVASWLLEIGKGSVSAPDQGMNSHLPAAHCRMGGPPCWEALNTERKAAFFLLPQSFDADRNRWGGSPPPPSSLAVLPGTGGAYRMNGKARNSAQLPLDKDNFSRWIPTKRSFAATAQLWRALRSVSAERVWGRRSCPICYLL